MDQDYWIALRAYASVGLVLVVALIFMGLSEGAEGNPYLIGVAKVLSWLALTATGGSFVLAATVSFRLWQWQQGNGPDCLRCGGPLGFDRQGISSYGGAYRRCWRCGGNINHRYYN